jgi:hypothetical protein
MKRKKSGSITGRCRTGRVTEKPFRTVEWLKTPDSKRVADSHFGASLPTPATRVKYSRQLARCQSYVTDKPIRRADRPRRKRSRAGRVHGRICLSGVDAKSGLRHLAAPGRVERRVLARRHRSEFTKAGEASVDADGIRLADSASARPNQSLDLLHNLVLTKG